MNKAFVREPEFNGRAYCPRCESLGTPVGEATLDRHLQKQPRLRMGDSAWFCDFPRCDEVFRSSMRRARGRRSMLHSRDPAAVHEADCRASVMTGQVTGRRMDRMNEEWILETCSFYGNVQSSTFNPGTRSKSTRLRVRTVRSRDIAIEEIRKSIVATRTRCCLRSSNTSAAASSNGRT